MKKLKRLFGGMAVVGASVAMATSSMLAATTSAQAATTAEPSLPGPITAVAAAKKGNSAVDIVVARLTDGRLFATAGAQSQYPGGWHVGWFELPGGMRSKHAPAIATWGHGVEVAVTGMDDRVYVKNMDVNGIWGPWYSTGNAKVADAPSIVGDPYDAGSLMLVARGFDNEVWYQTYLNNAWEGWAKVPGGLKTSTAVAVTRVTDPGVPGRVLMVATSQYGDVLYMLKPLFGSWPAWKPVPGGALTHRAPAAASLYPNANGVVITGTDGTMRGQIMTTDPVTFKSKWMPTWTALSGTNATRSAPALSNYFAAYIVGYHGVGVWTQAFRGYYNNQTQAYSSMPPAFDRGWENVPRSIPLPPVEPEPQPQKADLVWTGPPTYDAATQKVSIPFRNAGTAATGGFRVSIQFDAEPYSDVIFENVPAGQTGTVHFKTPLPLWPGLHTYNFQLDLYNTVAESNENNNNYNGLMNV